MPPRARMVTRSQASNQEDGEDIREAIGSEFDPVEDRRPDDIDADASPSEDDVPGNAEASGSESDDEQVTHYDENHSLPWLESIAEKQLQIIKNLTYKKLRKEDAIEILEINIEEETPPQSLRINLKVSVTKPQQEEIDEVVRDAIWKCQKTIMEGILVARNEELAQLNQDIADAKDEMLRKKNHMMHLMNVRNATIHPDVVKKVMDKFKADVRHTINKAKQSHILKKYEKDQKADQLKQERAEEEVEKSLEDPEMRKLKSEISALRNTVKSLQGKGKAKPGGRKNPGGGDKSNNEKDETAAAPKSKKKQQQQKPQQNQNQNKPRPAKKKARGGKRNHNARQGAGRGNQN